MALCPSCGNNNPDLFARLTSVLIATPDYSTADPSTHEIHLLACANCACVVADHWLFGQKLPATPKRRAFTPPTIADVRLYCAQRKNQVNAERWYAHYESNGWMVGKNKMKDWKAAVRTWEHNAVDSQFQPVQPKTSDLFGFLNHGKE